MLYKREGFPEEDELVMCTVTKIFPHSVFVNIDEFGNTGVIHISEISPGRIRNIRDFVKQDKKIICKVLRINRERGHIDLSLRRVNDAQRRGKSNEVKQEQLAEKILEFVAKKLKKDLKVLYNSVMEKVSKEYPSLYSCFEEVIESDLDLSSLGIEKKLSDELTEVIKQRIKPAEVEIKGTLNLASYDPNGIEIVKEALEKTSAVSKDVYIHYKAAGKYTLKVKAPNYPEAEEILKKATQQAIDHIGDNHGEASFTRDK
ncbi:translation initiation factor IF-2 subunit alpha [Candidatus Woesearchaeota archaeon]|jgi:translation initiation factor 2 subunit 1|nr:translation initiation factor IF-2 subunit alpha [Candidatus Woesearchaeota archaeon]